MRRAAAIAVLLLLMLPALAYGWSVYEKPAIEGEPVGPTTVSANDSTVFALNSVLPGGRVDLVTFYTSEACSIRFYSGAYGSHGFTKAYYHPAGESYDYPINADSAEVFALSADTEVRFWPWRF